VLIVASVRESKCGPVENALLIEEAESGEQELTVEFQQFKKLHINVLVDY